MAAATAHGLVHITDSDDGSPRGFFCGMGVCGECTVTLFDGSCVRACMTSCGQIGASAAGQPSPDVPEEPDLLVIGGGPAGLAAARAGALHGLRVVLLDERDKLGGQYYKQPSDAAAGVTPDFQMTSGARLIADVRGLCVQVVTQAVVWGAFRPMEFAVLIGHRTVRIRPRRAVLATGAFERGLPLPGWTLPGVMTTGAAQTLLRAHGIPPGRRVLIAGNGPLNFQLAYELLKAGAQVVALAEAASTPGWASLRSVAGLMHAPPLLAQGFRYLASIVRAGTHLHYTTVLAGIEGDGRAQRARLRRIDASGRPSAYDVATYDVDLVCMGYGLEPQNELARLLGCDLRHDAGRGTFAVATDEDGATSVPGVLVAGDGGGRVGAHAALAQGWLAGCRAARDLDRPTPPELLTETRRCRARLAQHRKFQSALWSLFRAPELRHELAAADTPICRCENVSLAEIEAELDGGVTTIGALKRATRAGMGRCQGRYCGPVLIRLLATRSGTPLAEPRAFAPRPPVRPVPIASVARGPES
ncbi:FAD-dependent oxidoreductase [Falsiroseomonas oryzae]|uniref:FAD-dependent oxidoreductase n=1 Tax=Falsiroseomonas oryzae TaxID=2766473 RepID=UPI0022EB372A|nr:FAD-dependent oxidoreductase [Roseomonas sp. MO-31]